MGEFFFIFSLIEHLIKQSFVFSFFAFFHELTKYVCLKFFFVKNNIKAATILPPNTVVRISNFAQLIIVSTIGSVGKVV